MVADTNSICTEYLQKRKDTLKTAEITFLIKYNEEKCNVEDLIRRMINSATTGSNVRSVAEEIEVLNIK